MSNEKIKVHAISTTDNFLNWETVFSEIAGVELLPPIDKNNINNIDIKKRLRQILIISLPILEFDEVEEDIQNFLKKYNFKTIITNSLIIKKKLEKNKNIIGDTIVLFIDTESNLYSLKRIRNLILDLLDTSDIIKTFQKTEVIKINIRNMFLFTLCPCDFYIHLDDKDYRYYLNKNAKLNERIIANLRQKNIYSIYIEKQNESLFFEETLSKIQERIQLKNVINFKDIAKLTTLTFSVIGDYLKFIGPNDSIKDLIINYNNFLMKFFENNSKTFNKTYLFSFPLEHIDYYERASLLVLILFNISKNMNKWTGNKNFQKILLSSIVFDLYLDEDKFPLIEQINSDFYLNLSNEQKIYFKKHIELASKTANYFNTIQEADYIIDLHHCDQINPDLSKQVPIISSLFFLTNKLIEHIFVYGFSKVSLNEILEYLTYKYSKSNHAKALDILIKSI